MDIVVYSDMRRSQLEPVISEWKRCETVVDLAEENLCLRERKMEFKVRRLLRAEIHHRTAPSKDLSCVWKYGDL